MPIASLIALIALLDLLHVLGIGRRRLGLALLAAVLGRRLRGQVGVRPGVPADRVTGRGHLLEDVRMPERVLADREEDRLRAMLRQRIEHRARVGGPGAVVEREHDLFQHQEVVRLVLLEAEARPAGGVHLDGARDAQRIGIGAGLRQRGRDRCCKRDARRCDCRSQAHGHPRCQSSESRFPKACGAGRNLRKLMLPRHALFSCGCVAAGASSSRPNLGALCRRSTQFHHAAVLPSRPSRKQDAPGDLHVHA